MANKQKTNPEGQKRYKPGTHIPVQSSYELKYCDKIVEAGKKGHSFTQFCASIEVSKRVVIDWRTKYPEFEAAYQDFVMHARAYWEKLGQEYVITVQEENGAGEKFDTSLYKFITGGRFGMSHQPDIDIPELETGTLDQKHRAAMRALARGQLTPNQASVISQMLKDAMDIDAHGDMKQRMEEIERRIAEMGGHKPMGKVAEEPEYEIAEGDK